MRLRPVRLVSEYASEVERRSQFLVLGAGATAIALVVPLIVFYAVQLLLATLLVWAGVAALTAANLYWYWLRTKEAALTPQVIREVTVVHVNRGHYRCHIDPEKVGGYIRHDRLLIGGALATLAVTVVSLTLYYGAGSLNHLMFGTWFALMPVAPWVSALVAATGACCGIAVAYSRVDPGRRLMHVMEAHVEPMLESANATVDLAARNLDSTMESVKQLSGELKIDFPVSYEHDLLRTLENHLDSALEAETPLKDGLREIEHFAGRDRNELQKAYDLFKAADTLFGQVVPEVNRTGLMPLIRDLDSQYRDLSSPKLKALLEQRQWQEYEQTVQGIANAMNRVRDLAENTARQESERQSSRQEPPKQEAPRQETEKPQPPPSANAPANETKEDRAYRILGLPAGADREHIQKAYRWLSSIWHPDRQMTRNDEQMKEINWAYNYLKKYRSPPRTTA